MLYSTLILFWIIFSIIWQSIGTFMHEPILKTAIKLTLQAAKLIRRDLGRSDRL